MCDWAQGQREVWLRSRLTPMVLVTLLFSGCVDDTKGVVDSVGAETAPGLAGAWVHTDRDGTRTRLHVKDLGDRYAVTRQEGNRKAEVYERVDTIPIKLAGSDTYIASVVPQSGAKQRWLFVIKPRADTLEVRTTSIAEVKKVAARVGVSVDINGRLGPGVQLSDALKLLTALAEEDFKGETLYKRAGWFSESPAGAVSLDSAEALIKQGKGEDGLGLFVYMANRGHTIAQFRAAQMLANGSGGLKDAELASWYYLSSYRSGHSAAAAALARHLEQTNSVDPKHKEGPVFWWAVAYELQGNVARSKAEVLKAAQRYCQTRPALKKAGCDPEKEAQDALSSAYLDLELDEMEEDSARSKAQQD